MSTATLARPASPKQVDFVTNLLRDRDVPANYAEWLGAPDELSGKDASDAIEFLLARPYKPRANAVTEPGFYRHDGEIYRFQPNRARTGIYAKVLVEEEGCKPRWEYAPSAKRVVSASDKMSADECQALSLRIGQCIKCSAVLTRAQSIKQSMGDICYGKLSRGEW